MAFKIKGQTKATAANKVISAISCPIRFKFCVQVAYWPTLIICFMAFENKGQAKAHISLYRYCSISCPILFKVCVRIPNWQPLTVCFMAFKIKGQTKAVVAFIGISNSTFFNFSTKMPGSYFFLELKFKFLSFLVFA